MENLQDTYKEKREVSQRRTFLSDRRYKYERLDPNSRWREKRKYSPEFNITKPQLNKTNQKDIEIKLREIKRFLDYNNISKLK